MEGGGKSGQAAAAMVAQRLCDLLLQFPAAAISGVRWKVLVKRYEERYGGRLDISSLGHSSAVAAATALLWDVLRVVSTEDADSPTVAVEDGIALTPRPSYIGTWPSLYVTLRSAVQSSGALEPLGEDQSVRMRGLLLSQLKPLLQSHWHANFDDYGMSYLSEDGTLIKMKKMKHLVQAVLQWRDQRVEWRQASGSKLTEADKVLNPRMELVVSKSHNDLVLRCPEESNPPTAKDTVEVEVEESPDLVEPEPSQEEKQPTDSQALGAGVGLEDQLSTCSTASRQGPGGDFAEDPLQSQPEEDLERELAELRAENEALRRTNTNLLLQSTEQKQQPAQALEQDVFDDPFEPPPQRARSWAYSVASASTPGLSSAASCSTPVPVASTASFEIFSSTTTRASMTPLSNFDVHSGAMTPVPAASLGDKVCALVPMWFSWMPSSASFLGDRSDIPTGIVDRIRSQFESAAGPDTAKPVHPPQDWRL